MTGDIAIIGAGMAGLAAARTLADAGCAVTIYEKSRGLGGRMATRRAGDLRFDHGAQFVTAKGPRFRAAVERWRAMGLADEWFEGGYVGAPGMTAPARELAAGCMVSQSQLVTGLRRDARGWTVCGASGPIDAPGNGVHEAVLIAVPAPQAAPLVASAGCAFPQMARPVYAPCWALMLAFDERIAIEDRSRPDDDVIAWIARDASKPGRNKGRETVVVHAAPHWSRANLERTAEAAGEDLLARFAALTGVTARPSHTSAHRWRFALVETPLEEPFLWDASRMLGLCGDWCLGARVEAAFDSGVALAEALLEDLRA